MSLIKIAISSAPVRLAMQKVISEQAGSKAGASLGLEELYDP